MRAAIYCRISKDTEGAGAGVARQEADCRAYVEGQGWDLAEVYVDNSKSAYDRRKVRPAYQRMLRALRAGDHDAIVVWHLDRLYRHPVELEEIIELVEAKKVDVATVTGGDYDLTTTDGRAMARVVVAFARKEVEDKSRRHLRQHQELAKEGRWQGGGSRPYGYSCSNPLACTVEGCAHDRGRSLVPAEADYIREAAAHVLGGGTLRGVCAQWNAAGVSTVSGGQWTTHVLRRILTSSHTAGLRAHRGVVTAKGQWPAILTEGEHRRLVAVLTDPARRTNEVGATRSYLLSGFLVCWKCGARLVARPSANKVRGYVCAKGPGFHGCGGLRIMAEPLEEVVALLLFDMVDGPNLVAAVKARKENTDQAALLDEIAADEAALADLAHDRYVARTVNAGQFTAASQALEARIAATRRRLVRSEADTSGTEWAGQGGALAAAWPSMTLDVKRATLAAYLDRIVIGPGVRGLNTFDADRLTPARGGDVVWRDFG